MPPGAKSTHLVGVGMWFVMLAILTAVCALVAVAKNIGVFTTLGLLAA